MTRRSDRVCVKDCRWKTVSGRLQGKSGRALPCTLVIGASLIDWTAAWEGSKIMTGRASQLHRFTTIDGLQPTIDGLHATY